MTRTVTIPMKPRSRHQHSADEGAPPPNARPPGHDLVVVACYIATLTTPARQLRKYNPKKVAKVAANIMRFGPLRPILVTKAGEIVDGELIVLACKELGIERVPGIVIDGYTEAEIRTIRLSLAKLPEGCLWDKEALALEFAELLEIDPTLIEFTGFELAEVDGYITDLTALSDDDAPELNDSVVSRLGDLWVLDGKHKLLCGNSRDGVSYGALLTSELAQFVLTDPPYGCRIEDNVSRTHGEFAEGSDLSETEAYTLFSGFLSVMTPHLVDGAIVDMFIDARGMFALMQSVRRAGLEQKTLVCWDKGIGGMGSLYRQQAEFVVVTKWGTAPHVNNVRLGKHGRNRTTVWSVPGLAQTGTGRKAALALHPTVKPVALLMDAILDTSTLGGIVLDPFAGSGSTLIAAHRTKRVGYGIELDPKYVDVAVARMERVTGKPAIHLSTGLTFAAMAEQRRGEPLAPAAAALVQA